MNVLILDLEVENYEHLGSIASPRNPQNYVVAPGWAYGMGEVQHAYYSSKEESRDWLPSLDGVDCIVAHNAPFELEWMLHDHWDKLIQYFARGGRVFCTAYAEYLLSNQQSQYPSLDETAPKYGGTRKIDEVKLLWEQGYKTSQIDRDLLVEYLAGHGGELLRIHQRRCQFRQGQQHEGAFAHARVGHGELGAVQPQRAIQQQVQIQRARRVAVGALAAGGLFNPLQGVQQLQGGQRGVQLGHGIEVIGPAGIDGRAAVER